MKITYSKVITLVVCGLGASFLAAVLLLAMGFFSEASGQNTPPANVNPCTGQPATAPYYTDIDLTKPWPACPSATLPRVDANSAGILGWRWCRSPTTGDYKPQWATIPWSDFQAQPMLALRLNAAGLSMNEDALKAVTVEYAALIKPLAHPSNTAIWCPLWPKVLASKPAPTPPATWIVARNGTLSTRPTYPVLGGTYRSRTSNGSVPVGADCNAVGGIVEGALLFGFPAGALPNSVALCVRR